MLSEAKWRRGANELNARPDVCGTLYGLLTILKGSERQNPGFNLIFVLSFPFELSTLNFEPYFN
jgi:hypothetical protein